MSKRKKILLLLTLLPGVSGLFAADPDVRLTNVGKMHIADNSATSLYIPASVRMLGSEVDVVQNGRTALDGDFVNDISLGNVFNNSSTGWYYFRGNAAQWIKGSASKQTNYINFPNVETSNEASVSLDALMGMNVDTLKLSEGKFVLKSIQDASLPSASQLAHLLVKGDVVYTRGAITPEQNGVMEIELFLGDDRNARFFGWTSPYKRTYSDYLFYNFLMEPTSASLFGDRGATITNAEYPLMPGRGYLIGQGVYGDHSSSWENPDASWGDALYEDRFTGMLTLNRYGFKDILNKSIAVASHRPDSYTMEELNTEDIVMSLPAEGYHFLGNPYTTPLDMTDFVSSTNDYSNNPWGVTRGENGTEDVYNMFWVVSQGNAYAVNAEEKKFRVNVTYLVGQEVGSTYELYPDVNGLQIAPMQLFVVYANKPLNFTIPESERTHGNISFLRSSMSAIDNELLLEVIDSETKGFDRTCVVFRPGANLAATDPYDAAKIFNRSGGVSQIWLPSAGSDLSTSVVPYETSSLEVTWLPAATLQKCTMTAHRLKSLTAPECVLLEDRQTGIITDLQVTPAYTFQSAPTDRGDRFALHFRSLTGIDTPVEGTLSCYYNEVDREIVIRGVQETDAQSSVSLYDVQGRQIMSSEVGNGIVPFTATEGVYIVKVAGERGVNAKIVIR